MASALAGADVEQHAVDRGRVGGIDVDLLGGEGAAGEQQRQRPGICSRMANLIHGMTPCVGCEWDSVRAGSLDPARSVRRSVPVWTVSASGPGRAYRRIRRHRRRATPRRRVGKILTCARLGIDMAGPLCPNRPRARQRSMDSRKIERFVAAKWDDEIVPQLVEYIRIPNKSPMFDADWVAARLHGRRGQADGGLGAGADRSRACRSKWCAWKAARR